MSLLGELFETFSRYHYRQFIKKADRELPASLLAFVEVPAPGLRERLGRIGLLLSDSEAGHDANPEIYVPLHRLAAGEHPAAAEADVGLLELHLGLVELDRLSHYPDGYYRLVERAGDVFEVGAGEVAALKPRPFRNVPDLGARVYLPYPHLFADVHSEEHYPAFDASSEWEGGLARLAAAAASVACYSPELFREMDAFLSCVGLLPSASSLVSTSVRLSFFRAVFLNPFGHGVDVDVMAELLIHEYYHQRMRQWWFYEPVEGLPGEETRMVSPFSGEERSIEVMLQALVIYLEGMRYHLSSLSRGPVPGSRSPDRLEGLARGITVSAPELARRAPPGSEFADQVAFLTETFRELTPAASEALSRAV